MSVQTIVNASAARRLQLRRMLDSVLQPQADVAAGSRDSSMRFLEASLAFTAIATAILIGAGH